MLTLILGRFGAGKSTEIKNRVKALTEKGVASFLLVPEQATVHTERAYAEALPPSAPLYFEVTNFSRLANTVFRRAGGLSSHPTGHDGALFLMWRALHECRSLLSSPIDESKAENVQHFLSAMDEFRMLGIDAELLEEALPSLTSHKNLQTKIKDFLLVSTAYRTLLEKKQAGADGGELTRLALLLESAPYLDSAPLFFDGFVSLTAEEMRVIAALAQTNDLTFAIDCPTEDPPPLAYAEAYDTVCRLKELAKQRNVPLRLEKREEAFHPAHGVFHYVADSLFSSQPCEPYPEAKTHEGKRKPICIEECESVFTEANVIAAEICRLVQEEGARYRDILLVGRGLESYRGILDDALARNGIPFYFSEKADMEAFEPIKLILTAYRMRAANFRASDVIAYLKCGFSGISREDCDEMELYVGAWNLQATRFTDVRPWTFHPRGYTADPLNEQELALLERLNLAKATILDSFSVFGGAPCEKSVKEHARNLVLFLERLSLDEQLEKRARREEARGNRANASVFRMLYPCICRTLDRAVQFLGDSVISEKDFSALLSLAFSTVSVGTIPSAYDEVVIGDARMLRPSAPRHTFLFGVNEGVFPGIAEEGGFFSASERELLRVKAAISLKADAYFAASRERYDFLRAFLSPTDSLFITYPCANSALASLRPATVLSDVLALASDAAELRYEKNRSPLELLYRRASVLELLARAHDEDVRTLFLSLAKEDAKEAERASALDIPLVMPKCRITPQKTKGTLIFSQSKLDSFASCPFAYTCQYLLRLREDRIADFRYMESGIFVHAILEKLFKYLHEEHLSIADLSDEMRLSLLMRFAEEQQNALFADDRILSRRLSHTCRRLSAATVPVLDSLRNELSDSDFSPVFFELPIGQREGGVASSSLMLNEDLKIAFEGVIDRVDFCRIQGEDGRFEPYLRVIDYKTGTKTFDPKNIDRGMDLQMLLYLYTLCETKDASFRRKLGLTADERIHPAGMFYLMTTQKSLPLTAVAREDELRRGAASAIERSGLLLNDTRVIRAMAHEKADELFKLSLDRSGNLTAKSGITLATEEDIEDYFSVMKNRILSIGQRITEGEAHALPLIRSSGKSSACAYCAYKSVCRNSKNPKALEE